MNRRRFLSISAAATAVMATPGHARTHRWQGRALGAEVEITIDGPTDIAHPALTRARAVLAGVERQFSLFDSQSALSRLNAQGRLRHPGAMFEDIMRAADLVHRATDGLFDPSVQPLWRALATGGDPAPARAAIGWTRLRRSPDAIALAPGQALTFNGIAQGYATDNVAAALTRAGLTRTLVNIGEFRGTGGPWRLGIADPVHGMLGARTITDSAVATSSPGAVPLLGHGHILHRAAQPRWSTVSVEAASATIADGFSTALSLAPLGMIEGLIGRHGIRRITLVDETGDLRTIG